MSVRVSVNRAALTSFLQRDPGVQAALKEQAETLKADVDRRAEGFKNTGHFAARTYVRKFRHGYQVVNGDTFAFMVEYGTQNNPAYRPLTGAAKDIFGARFSESDKPEDGGDG